MTEDPIVTDDEVTPKPAGKAKASRQSEEKWGAEVMGLGFCILPSLVFRAQSRLGLNPTQLVVLLQLADFWWDSGRKPFPKKADLAERLSLSERQVQRYIADLETAASSSGSSAPTVDAARSPTSTTCRAWSRS